MKEFKGYVITRNGEIEEIYSSSVETEDIERHVANLREELCELCKEEFGLDDDINYRDLSFKTGYEYGYYDYEYVEIEYDEDEDGYLDERYIILNEDYSLQEILDCPVKENIEEAAEYNEYDEEEYGEGYYDEDDF